MEMNKTPAQVLSPSKQMTVSRSEIIAAYKGSGTIPLISASRIYYRALLRGFKEVVIFGVIRVPKG